MRKQTIKKNLLIVCEGEITEPFYFKILADRAIENGEWDNVEIVPKPRLSENEDEKAWKSSKRPKRMFKNLDVKLPSGRKSLSRGFPPKEPYMKLSLHTAQTLGTPDRLPLGGRGNLKSNTDFCYPSNG